MNPPGSRVTKLDHFSVKGEPVNPQVKRNLSTTEGAAPAGILTSGGLRLDWRSVALGTPLAELVVET